jgi:hypothetical protein
MMGTNSRLEKPFENSMGTWWEQIQNLGNPLGTLWARSLKQDTLFQKHVNQSQLTNCSLIGSGYNADAQHVLTLPPKLIRNWDGLIHHSKDEQQKGLKDFQHSNIGPK